MWTDGQTDITKVIVAFRDFANAPKNEWFDSSPGFTFLFSEAIPTASDDVNGKMTESYELQRMLGKLLDPFFMILSSTLEPK
jgi:hypothetical protein